MVPAPAVTLCCAGQLSTPAAFAGLQGPPTIVLLDSGGLVEGEGGNLYSREVFTFRKDHTERMLDLRALAKVSSSLVCQVLTSDIPGTCSLLSTSDNTSSSAQPSLSTMVSVSYTAEGMHTDLSTCIQHDAWDIYLI